MNIRIEERALNVGEKFVLQKEQNPTVRSIAKELGVSKSTIHKDVSERLKECNLSLYKEVQEILEKNTNEKHLRGGEATKIKYLRKG